jgi:hemerythrin-like domain-containing protein
MTADNPNLTDVRDMYSVHEAFRRGLGDARSQVTAVGEGDTERARYLADYLSELLWLLHVHHESEDELLYPLLSARAPEHQELFSRMDAQHRAVTSSLETAQRAAERFGTTGSVSDGKALVAACESLLETLAPHLGEEEDEVLPIAARVISPEEWGALPGHALSQYTGTRVWLPFGLAIEAMPEDLLEGMREHLPPPVAAMWFGGGSDAFAQEMAVIRQPTP